MTAYRVDKRGTLFGVQDGRTLRADFAEAAIINPAVTDAGLPVPVLFGTRFLDPTVVGWASLAEWQTQYYLAKDARSATLRERYHLATRPQENYANTQRYNHRPEFRDDHENFGEPSLKMILMSMRMVLCVGGIDSIARFSGGDIPFFAIATALPRLLDTVPSGASQAVRVLYDNLANELRKRKLWGVNPTTNPRGSTRMAISIADSDLYGDGGLGFPDGEDRTDLFKLTSTMSEFWISQGLGVFPTKTPNHEVLDLDTLARGVTSLYFENFNFGNDAPLKKWRICATRINTQTAREKTGQELRAPSGDTPKQAIERYKPQWQPELARLRELTIVGASNYYFIVIDGTLSESQLRRLKDYVLALPNDNPEGNPDVSFSTTRYRIMVLPYQDCVWVKNQASIAYRFVHFSYDTYATNVSRITRQQPRSRFSGFQQFVSQWSRSFWFGRAFWKTTTMTVQQARDRGIHSEWGLGHHSVIKSSKTDPGTGQAIPDPEKFEVGADYDSYPIPPHYGVGFNDPFIVEREVQYPITIEIDEYVIRARSMIATTREFTIQMSTFNLTTKRDDVARFFDERIALARRKRFGVLTACKLLRGLDGEQIVKTYADDVFQLTAGGKDIRLTSVALFAMTNVFGTTGPEPITAPQLQTGSYSSLTYPKVTASNSLFIRQQTDMENRYLYKNRAFIFPRRANEYQPFRTPLNFLDEFVNKWMQRLKFPREIPTPANAPETYRPPLTDSQWAAIERTPPEVRVIRWDYDIAALKRAGGFQFTLVEGSTYSDDIARIDSNERPIDMLPSGSEPTPEEFVANIGLFQPFGYAMNPVHALRECLINHDWGEGIDEQQIDEDSFFIAARTCKNEGLDFCYVHNDLGGVSKLVTDITDYIEGVVYYEAATDKVVLRLLRYDYDLDNILAFNETNISSINNYRHQHTDETTNSVTVRFHEAALGSQSSFTVHDVEAASRGAGVVAETLNYDGCATPQAAAVVAVRELNALSKPVISFSAVVDVPEDHHVGLGEPLLFSYRDLGIDKVVMRVSSIDYGDGTTGGITLDLIQDHYFNIQKFDPQVDPEGTNTPVAPPTPINPLDEVLFLEAGYERLNFHGSGVTLPTSPTIDQSYIQAGLRATPDRADINSALIDAREIRPCIGTLLTPIPSYYGDDPRDQNFIVRVRIEWSARSFADDHIVIRIDDELFYTNRRFLGFVNLTRSSGLVDFVVTRRAYSDTVTKSHEIGADVWFLNFSWVDHDVYSPEAFAITFQQADVLTRRVVNTPNIPVVGRVARPYPPYFFKINNCWGPRLRMGGDLRLDFLQKREPPWDGDRSANMLLTATFRGNELFANTIRPEAGNTFLFKGYLRQQLDKFQSVRTPRYEIQFSLSSVYNEVSSWQSWETTVDWSYDSVLHSGWNRNWNRDWSAGSLEGWDYDWDQSYGD